jgi:F0F1-type ATP synthase epsilon subunit
MQLHIYSLKGVLFEGEAKSVNLMTDLGEITILDNHEPFLTVLKERAIRITDAFGKENFVQASGGFLEVKPNNEVSVLIN